MRWRYLRDCFAATAIELVRRRITIILLFLIPTLFYIIVNYTTGDQPLVFKLASISEEAALTSTARHVSLTFIGIATVGLLTAFLAMNLVQKDLDATRRLVLCGYRPSELMLSKLCVMLCFVAAIGIYVAALVGLFFQPEHWAGTVLGYVLGGFVYGSYGLLVGTIFRRELEGILFVVLLANIDAGWLQNPVFYAAAEHTELIHRMPAYFPSQVSLTAAFTDYSIARPMAWSVAYGVALLFISVSVYWARMRLRHAPFSARANRSADESGITAEHETNPASPTGVE